MANLESLQIPASFPELMATLDEYYTRVFYLEMVRIGSTAFMTTWKTISPLSPALLEVPVSPIKCGQQSAVSLFINSVIQTLRDWRLFLIGFCHKRTLIL